MDGMFSGVFTIVAFLTILVLLVLVHELGHFLTARAMDIPVEEFGIGFPPRAAVLFERGGTKYTLNWLPLGGFVRFAGDSGVYGSGGLAVVAPWKKILVLLAGPLANLVLAALIFIIIFLVRGVPVVTGVVVNEVYPGTPSAVAGFRTNDIITALDGQPITGADDIRAVAVARLGEPVVVQVQRDGAPLELTVTPGPWSYGTATSTGGYGFVYRPQTETRPADVPTAIGTGVSYTGDVLLRFGEGFGQLFGGLTGANAMPEGGVTGVVGIARGTGQVFERDGWLGLANWMAIISLNLFLVNLLPIPALDGSHILFSLIEIVRRGRKIPPEREATVHAFGFIMLMCLMVVITVSDVSNWVRGMPALGGG